MLRRLSAKPPPRNLLKFHTLRTLQTLGILSVLTVPDPLIGPPKCSPEGSCGVIHNRLVLQYAPWVMHLRGLGHTLCGKLSVNRLLDPGVDNLVGMSPPLDVVPVVSVVV